LNNINEKTLKKLKKMEQKEKISLLRIKMDIRKKRMKIIKPK